MNVSMLALIPEVLIITLILIFFLFLCQLSDFHYPIFRSLIHASPSSNLLLIPYNILFCFSYCIIWFIFMFSITLLKFSVSSFILLEFS